MKTERKLLLLSCGYLGTVVVALTVPRIAARGQEGLAAAGTAAFWFLLIALLALILSTMALVTVIRAWKRLSVRSRVTGTAPSVLSAAAILSLTLYIRHEASRESDPPPGPATAPASNSSPVNANEDDV